MMTLSVDNETFFIFLFSMGSTNIFNGEYLGTRKELNAYKIGINEKKEEASLNINYLYVCEKT